jgi:hypothetical protein
MEPILKLSHKEVMEYGAQHVYAKMMFVGSAEDYISARCLISNTLVTGFVLHSQSVEKYLKALIFLETGRKPKLPPPTIDTILMH